MHLDSEIVEAFTKHALAEYPKEACGVVVKGKYFPCTNVADQPTKTFRVSAYEMGLIEAKEGKVDAVLHSHPYNKQRTSPWPPEWPSAVDMECWLKGSSAWGIAATDGEGMSQLVWLDDQNPEPLEGRQFIHGVNDCYSVVRDWFRQERGIDLPNYPRQIDWWDNGQDLYSENFAKAGFVEIPASQATVGDCALFQVKSPVINHAAVITGPNTILHHLFHRLSGKDSLQKWARVITKYVRYQGPQQ